MGAYINARVLEEMAVNADFNETPSCPLTSAVMGVPLKAVQ